MKVLLIAALMLSALTVQAGTTVIESIGNYTVKTEEIKTTAEAVRIANRTTSTKQLNPIAIGEMISVARDVVGLGEEVYNLVSKGKPTVNNEWAAVNVVPFNPEDKTFIHPYELEKTSAPIRRSFRKTLTHLKMTVATIEYMLVYQVGEYDGKGMYIQNLVIVPTKVLVRYGVDFSSKMKLVSVSNAGTKDDPIATALVSMTYNISGMFKNEEITDLINVTGTRTAIVQK